MPAAGETIIAGRVPGERIATTTRTSNSSGVTTTETVVDSVTASLVSGRTYKVRWFGQVFSTVADGYVRLRIREDNVTGTEVDQRQQETNIAASQAFPVILEGEYTAAATASKTFVATIIRQVGTGTVTAQAGSANPTRLTVDYVSG
jgi:hypothetical protein